MRLIDADVENGKLLDFVAEHDNAIQYTLEHKDMTMLEDIFFEYFEAQKIAYDAEKVIHQIRKAKDEYGMVDYINDKPVIAKEQAIEIIKNGGIE